MVQQRIGLVLFRDLTLFYQAKVVGFCSQARYKLYYKLVNETDKASIYQSSIKKELYKFWASIFTQRFIKLEMKFMEVYKNI